MMPKEAQSGSTLPHVAVPWNRGTPASLLKTRRVRLRNDNGSKARRALFLFTEAWRGRTARVTRLSPARLTSHFRLHSEDSLQHPHAAI